MKDPQFRELYRAFDPAPDDPDLAALTIASARSCPRWRLLPARRRKRKSPSNWCRGWIPGSPFLSRLAPDEEPHRGTRLWMDTERAVGPRRSLRTAAFAPQART